MIANQRSSDSSGEESGPKRGRKLLERPWDALLAEGFAEAVARRYVSWMRDYVLSVPKRSAARREAARPGTKSLASGTKLPKTHSDRRSMRSCFFIEPFWTANWGRSCRSADGTASGCRWF